MNKAELIKAGVNYDEGVKRFSGMIDIYEEFLQEFIDDEYYPNMVKALRDNDNKKAFGFGHALKGIVGNLSMNDFYKDIAILVELLRHDGSSDEINALFQKIDAEHVDIIAALKK